MLKGGFALELRLADLARTTKDIDIDWMPQDELVVDLLLDAADADHGCQCLPERGNDPGAIRPLARSLETCRRDTPLRRSWLTRRFPVAPLQRGGRRAR